MLRPSVVLSLCLGATVSLPAASAVAAEAPMMATAPAETIRLWQDDAPGAKGKADHDVPVVAWWPAPQATSPTAAIVVCPGGGYGGLADHEGSDYAKWLNTRGISAFVLRYRLGSKGYRHPVMLGDVSRALRLVRHDHERFKVDPKRVGVMGSSAGGHLALTACMKGDDGDPQAADAIDRQPARPALGILCYPVVSMMPDKTHGGSRKNLLGDAPDLVLVLDVDLETAARRLARPLDKLENRGDGYRARLRAGYQAEAAADPARIQIVDAAAGVDEVAGRIRAALSSRLPELA